MQLMMELIFLGTYHGLRLTLYHWELENLKKDMDLFL